MTSTTNEDMASTGKNTSTERVADVIADVMREPSGHSVDEKGRAVATQFYVMEVVHAHASHEASVGDSELLLSDDQYGVGEIREVSHHSDTPVKLMRVVSGSFNCPPMPHVLALEAWVSENGIDEYLQWGDENA